MKGRTLNVPKVAILSGLVLFLLVSQVSADSSWNYKIISDPELNGIHAGISGDSLVYTGSIGNPMLTNSTRVVQLYSLSTGTQKRIAASDPGSVITGESIDGNYIVWFSTLPPESTADAPNRIFLYSIADQNLTMIGASPDASWPKISGQRVIWSESRNNSFASSVLLYDIRTGNTSLIPGISTINGAGIEFNGNYILYSDAKTPNLLLYETGTGATTTVFTPSSDNNTREIVFESALCGDYVLYRKDVMVENPRERYSELCLYTISTGKTSLISPLTGNVIQTLSPSDMSASFTVQSADNTRVAWVVPVAIADDMIMVLDPASMTVSSVSPKTFVDYVQPDGRNMTWLGTGSIGGKGDIYLATESGSPGVPAPTAPTRAPVFDLAMTVVCLLAGVFLAGNMKQGRER
jgi:hypothetical protein